MSVFQAVILGIVQGLTEFLPISSSAHLTLVPWALGWELPSLSFDTVLHMGTLTAVVFYFWRDIVSLLRAWWQSLRTRRLETAEARVAWLLIVATIPAVITGYFFEDVVAAILGTPVAVASILVGTGVLLFVCDSLGRRERTLLQLNLGDALAVGLAQSCAILPGLSRSGATMAAGLSRGLTREAAARFSFLLSLPITLGATVHQSYKVVRAGLTGAQVAPLVVGPLVALVTGYLAIRLLLGYVRAHSLRPFAYYCWALGLAGLILAWVR
jgi:undecaprenyl-diphosphatase